MCLNFLALYPIETPLLGLGSSIFVPNLVVNALPGSSLRTER